MYKECIKKDIILKYQVQKVEDEKIVLIVLIQKVEEKIVLKKK